ncbi:hypothetical protein [Hirschia litorea]|uniref:Methyl-accepting chemotaxis protein n=1 Tax=Hirschia litorea TaxID=1199156 RepID=A0ABW2ILV8_9PROT
MSNTPKPIQTKRDLEQRLAHARKAGGWMPWATTSLAFTWWGGTAAYVIGKFGIEELQALPPAELGGGIAMAAGPGLALIMSGFMARESTRSARANELVLAASETLLSPAKSLSAEVDSLGANLAKQSNEIYDTLNETEARVQVIRQDMEESSNAAMKAAEVVRADTEALKFKLAAERDELSSLSNTIRAQAAALSDAIPMHAEKMTRAATMAQAEVQKAGKQLDERLSHIETTGKNLSASAANLDHMTAESRKRAQQLVQSLMSINENLLGSSRTVDNALKAGDMAVEASKATAEAIRNAMDSALDGARQSAEHVSAQAVKSNTEAEEAMKRLIQTASRAEGLVKQAMQAANEQAEETEKRMDRMSEHMYTAATRATHAAEAGLERARTRIERASQLLNDGLSDTISSAERFDAPAQNPPASPRIAAPAPRASTVETPPRPTPKEAPKPMQTPASHDLTPFDPLEEEDTTFDTARHASDFDRGTAKPTASSEPASPVAAAAHEAHTIEQAANHTRAKTDTQNDMSWRDLLSGIGSETSDGAHDSTALAFVEQLDRSGIRLKRAIRSSDLRRIAAATSRGERQRRRATKQAAPGELTQIQRLLQQDEDLRIAAESYLALEEEEAMKFLQRAERAREDAGPRLAAYLLLDAALVK